MNRTARPSPEPGRRQLVARPPATADEAGDGRHPSKREGLDERVVDGVDPFALEVRGVEPRPDGRLWGPYVL